MARYFADLHVHSRASFDALASPRDIVRVAAERGLTHIAITDHDRIDGALAARDAAPGGLSVITRGAQTNGATSSVSATPGPRSNIAVLTVNLAAPTVAKSFAPATVGMCKSLRGALDRSLRTGWRRRLHAVGRSRFQSHCRAN